MSLSKNADARLRLFSKYFVEELLEFLQAHHRDAIKREKLKNTNYGTGNKKIPESFLNIHANFVNLS